MCLFENNLSFSSEECGIETTSESKLDLKKNFSHHTSFNSDRKKTSILALKCKERLRAFVIFVHGQHFHWGIATYSLSVRKEKNTRDAKIAPAKRMKIWKDVSFFFFFSPFRFSTATRKGRLFTTENRSTVIYIMRRKQSSR